MLDIFKNDAFSTTSLTDFVNDLKYRPGRLGQLGLFSTEGVTTTSIAIERMGDMLQLVKPTPRGGPGETRDMPKRKMTSLMVPHFQRDWGVMADEVQNVRAKGSESELATVRVAADANPEWATVWSGADGGSYPIDATAMVAISDAVQGHVNRCFVIYAGVVGAINEGTFTTYAQVEGAFA